MNSSRPTDAIPFLREFFKDRLKREEFEKTRGKFVAIEDAMSHTPGLVESGLKFTRKTWLQYQQQERIERDREELYAQYGVQSVESMGPEVGTSEVPGGLQGASTEKVSAIVRILRCSEIPTTADV